LKKSRSILTGLNKYFRSLQTHTNLYNYSLYSLIILEHYLSSIFYMNNKLCVNNYGCKSHMSMKLNNCLHFAIMMLLSKIKWHKTYFSFQSTDVWTRKNKRIIMIYKFLCTHINECLSYLCSNGGTCKDLVNEYECTCVAWYDGINCDDSKKSISP
jgi:hypothetical protein